MSLRPEETKARAAFVRHHHGLGTPHQGPEALAQIAGHPVKEVGMGVSGLPAPPYGPPWPAPPPPEIARARRDAEPPYGPPPPRVSDDTSDRVKMVLAHEPLVAGAAAKWRAIGRTGGAAGAEVYRPPGDGVPTSDLVHPGAHRPEVSQPVQAPRKPRRKAKTPEQRKAAPYRTIEVPDVGAACDELLAAGAEVIREPGRRFGLEIRARLRCLDGRQIALVPDAGAREAASKARYKLQVGDDYSQDAWETALRCWPAWDPTKGTYGAFARPHIDRALHHAAAWDRSMVRRMSDDRGRDVSLDGPATRPCDNDNAPRLWRDRIAMGTGGVAYDVATTDAENYEEEAAIGRVDAETRSDRVLAALPLQPPADQIAVRLRMGGAAYSEIGQRLGVGEDGARHRVERTAARLARDLTKCSQIRLSGSEKNTTFNGYGKNSYPIRTSPLSVPT